MSSFLALIYAAYVLSGFVGVAISVRKGQIPGWPDSLVGYALCFIIGPFPLYVALRD